jgi:16S rRNA (guanine527-N7)-methyltransferase
VDNLLAEGLSRLCADLDAAAHIEARLGEIRDLLEAYIEEIELFNPAYGLVKVTDRKELIVKHILDSLAPLGHLTRLLNRVSAESSDRRIADAGSGAGLPGIPLAICCPGTQTSLVERMGRRVSFLRNAAAVLGLSWVTVEETELEKAVPGRFDLVVFRALSPLESGIVKTLKRLLKPDGVLAAYKGRYKAAAGELAKLDGADRGEIISLAVPFLEDERCLVIL